LEKKGWKKKKESKETVQKPKKILNTCVLGGHQERKGEDLNGVPEHKSDMTTRREGVTLEETKKVKIEPICLIPNTKEGGKSKERTENGSKEQHKRRGLHGGESGKLK